MGERELLIQLLLRPAGYTIDLLGLAEVRRLEDGLFAVAFSEPEGQFHETLFDEAEQAVDLFLHYRRSKGLGFDFERGEA